MTFYQSDQEGLAWYKASDERWADRAGQLYRAAAKRRENDDAAQARDPAS